MPVAEEPRIRGSADLPVLEVGVKAISLIPPHPPSNKLRQVVTNIDITVGTKEHNFLRKTNQNAGF